jgi:phage tail-like protein
MPEYLAPGVYVEETAAAGKTIEGVNTSTCDFVGLPVRVVVDRHIIAGASRIGSFGWSKTHSIGSMEFKAFVLERDLTFDPVLDSWLRQAEGEANRDFRKMIVVELLDREGQVNACWRFRNAWPSKYRVMPIKVGESTAAVELVTIAHEGFQRVDVATSATVDYDGFDYLVELDGEPVAGFQEVFGSDNNADGTGRRLTGLAKFTHVTLKRGIAHVDALRAWRARIESGQREQRTITIISRNNSGDAQERLFLRNAVPQKFESADLNGTANGISIQTIEFAAEGVTFETGCRKD